MTTKLLQGHTILDLSHRLPGPLCGKILADLGAEVIKVEDHKFQDPFCAGLFAEFDESFKFWYENLNQNKKILRFDFNSADDQKKIQELVHHSSGVIMGLPQSTKKKLGLTDEELKLNRAFVVIELLASRKHDKSLHDLNALAHAGLLGLHVHERQEDIIDPPFLPISGISFGHKGATDFLAAMIKAMQEKQTIFHQTYLDEATEEVLGIFWPHKDRQNDRRKFLHNGHYPCYAIYRTRDHKFVALAAVEEKFWLKFAEIFEISIEKDKRFFNEDMSVFQLISEKIKQKSLSEIEELIRHDDLCLTPIP